jgi:tripeptide aminopeptidase
MSYSYTTTERFLRYVQIDTQSDPESTTFPSTAKQKNLAEVLRNELQAMGASEVELDEFGYVFATIPSTSLKEIPTLCFCAHMDTAPDCSGTYVKPIVHKNYQGGDLVLPDDTTQILNTINNPYLKERIGDDIITASGTTLLGADDKAGVAIIMDLANYLIQHPEVIHGKIRILFTPDEEVGRGVEKLDMKKLNAAYGYTLDSAERGSLEGESFSADGAIATIHGISAHPGYAKGKLVNAIKIASEFVAALPKDSWSPETTENLEGYIHPTSIDGNQEKAVVKFIIRDFETPRLAEHEARLESILKETVARYPGARYEFNSGRTIPEHDGCIERSTVRNGLCRGSHGPCRYNTIT